MQTYFLVDIHGGMTLQECERTLGCDLGTYLLGADFYIHSALIRFL